MIEDVRVSDSLDVRIGFYANRVKDFIQEHDIYEYGDVIDDENLFIHDIKQDILSLKTETIETYFKNIMEQWKSDPFYTVLKEDVRNLRNLLWSENEEKMNIIDAYADGEIDASTVGREVKSRTFELITIYKSTRDEYMSHDATRAELLYRQILSLKREVLLEFFKNKEIQELCSDKETLCIYQLKDTAENYNYMFRNSEYLEQMRRKIDIEDYEMVYSMPLEKGISLNDIYETFNLNHPDDYAGHSLSVGDVIVMITNDKGINPYFVDSYGFKKVDDFIVEFAVETPEGYITIQECTEGYDYSIVSRDYDLIDGGIYDNPDISIVAALRDVLEDLDISDYKGVVSANFKEISQKVELKESEKIKEQVAEQLPNMNNKVKLRSPRL